jgi:hypothetical protein
MAHSALSGSAGELPARGLFVVAVFVSAALVFFVEPMIAQLLLPRLGGSPAVWNTSLAFFQAALLAGYGYAHLLQRLGSVHRQMTVHVLALGAAALVLPLHISGALGPSSTHHPILWLLGVLALSIGPPFAVLSATAPLLQAWFGRTAAGANPYGLYAASNLGSLLSLLAYPFAAEPLLGLHVQTIVWSVGYAAFAILIVVLASALWKITGDVSGKDAAATGSSWRERIVWVLLAAAPSSLLLGVTTHITTDVASAPFLWVPPLALYLLTFVIAFSSEPQISTELAGILQASAAAVCLLIIPIRSSLWLPLLGVHLTAFFLTALVCHLALAERRPEARRLTDFYFWISLGGVVGGAFSAFLAPVIFNAVWEYPVVLVLAGLARPWGRGWPSAAGWAVTLLGVFAAALAAAPHALVAPWLQETGFVAVIGAALLMRNRAPVFTLLMAALAVGSEINEPRFGIQESWRSFFGVVQIGEMDITGLGRLRYMMHGSTLHGAQVQSPTLRCWPLTYYGPNEPIGQVLTAAETAHPSVDIGVIGLGTGVTATYARASDRMTFFEIDPLIARIAQNPREFSYLNGCAKGHVGVVLGDARLSLDSTPSNRFDVLLVDAFSSDSVPVHLLTVEAMRTYLRVLKPDGVVILHLSNRNLELTPPAAAIAAAAGASALTQTYNPPANTPLFKETTSSVLIAARTPDALAPFRRDPRWKPADPDGVRAWSDDYSNVLGALIARAAEP